MPIETAVVIAAITLAFVISPPPSLGIRTQALARRVRPAAHCCLADYSCGAHVAGGNLSAQIRTGFSASLQRIGTSIDEMPRGLWDC